MSRASTVSVRIRSRARAAQPARCCSCGRHAGPATATRAQPEGRERNGAHRSRSGHAPQPRTDRDVARHRVADAVFAARHVLHDDGQPPAAALAASPAARVGRRAVAPAGNRCIARCTGKRKPRCAAQRCARSPTSNGSPGVAAVRAPARPVEPARHVRRAPGTARAHQRDRRERGRTHPRRRSTRTACRMSRPADERDARAGRDGARRRRHRARLRRRADELRDISENCGQFPDRSRSARALAHRHREPARRIQQGARLLHRGHARPDRQGARRLPSAPDAEERRAPHHARAEDLEDKALSAQERALARERVLYDAQALLPFIPECQRVASALAGSTCSPHSPNAPARSTGSHRPSPTKSASKSNRAATRSSKRRSNSSSRTTAASAPSASCC